MAMDNEIILKVNTETGEAVKSVNDLKANIKALKENLGDLQVGSEEYQKTLDSLKVNQNALRNAMHATTASMEDVAKAANGAGQSYNALVARMAQMKEELRATDTSTAEGMERFKVLAANIYTVNNRLKELDAAQGNYQRNVGMYNDKIAKMGDAFRATAGGAGGMIAPLKNVTMGLKAMSSTPVIAIMGLLANVLVKVIDGLKGSEQNMRGVQQAMASLQPIMDLGTKMLQGLGKAVVWVSEKIGNLFKSVFPDLVKSQEDVISITQKDIELQDLQREAIRKNADDELKIAKLRAEAADKSNLSAQQRIALLQQASDLELGIMERQKEIATMEYEIAELNAKRSENSKEENDKLAEAYAKKVNIETAYYNKQRELTSAISKARKEMAAADTKATNEAKAASGEAAAIKKQEERDTVGLAKAYKESLEARLKYAVHYSDEEKQLKRDLLAANEALEIANIEKSIQDETKRQEAITLVTQKYIDERARLQVAEMERDNELQVLRMQNEMSSMAQGSFEALAKNIEIKKFELDTLHQLEGESDEEFKARQLKAEEEYQKAKAALTQKGVAMASQAAAATVSILNDVAAAYEDDINRRVKNGEISEAEAEKEFKRVKAIQIAVATINMLQGIATALSGAYTTKTGPWDWVLAGIQATSIGVSGAMNIAKIKNTQLGGGGSSAAPATSSAVASAPTITTAIPQVRTITNAEDEERLNERMQAQKVYILSSDIEASQNARKVQTEETSF